MKAKIESYREEVGNIEPTVTTSKSSKKVLKQGNQVKKYDFTYNNYEISEIETIERKLTILCCKFAFQEEIGESGTPHLQGCVWLKRAMRMTELLKHQELASCSWRPIRNWEAATKYCTSNDKRKPGGRVCVHNVPRPRKPIKILSNEQLFDWQKEIVEIIKKEPDERKIYWRWETQGKVGKSTFCKYLVVEHGALVLSGKAADIKYGIIKYIEKHGDYPEILIFDVPRTCRQFLRYDGIEEVKNALFFSGKYESDMVVGNPPHLFIFANFSPDKSTMSKDRWDVKNIGKNDDDGSCYSSDEF